jgi:hypothetical protein
MLGIYLETGSLTKGRHDDRPDPMDVGWRGLLVVPLGLWFVIQPLT